MENGVICKICGELPKIIQECGDNGSNFNGCIYRSECKCGNKGQEWRKSEMVTIADWENIYFKKRKVNKIKKIIYEKQKLQEANLVACGVINFLGFLTTVILDNPYSFWCYLGSCVAVVVIMLSAVVEK